MLIQTRVFPVVFAILLPVLAGAQTRKGADDPDQKELFSYVLTMDKIQKMATATTALTELGKRHPEVKSEASDSKNLDEMEKKLKQYPEVVSILGKNGLAPRDYAVGFMTLLQASIAVGSKKQGLYKEYPPAMLKLVSKQNLDFVDQHYEEIQKATSAMMANDKDQ
jgi:hypothetical protein